MTKGGGERTQGVVARAREAMEAKKLRQVDLLELVHSDSDPVSREAVRAIINRMLGSGRIPRSLDLRDKIAEALGTHSEPLFFGRPAHTFPTRRPMRTTDQSESDDEQEANLFHVKKSEEARKASRMPGPLQLRPDPSGYCVIATDNRWWPYANINDIIYLTPSYKPCAEDRVYIASGGGEEGAFEIVDIDDDKVIILDPRSETNSTRVIMRTDIVTMDRIGGVSFR